MEDACGAITLGEIIKKDCLAKHLFKAYHLHKTPLILVLTPCCHVVLGLLKQGTEILEDCHQNSHRRGFLRIIKSYGFRKIRFYYLTKKAYKEGVFGV